MIIPIKIRDVNDIEKVNNIVSKYPYDIWIHGKSGMADAKSILGMFILKLDEPLNLVLPDREDINNLIEKLREYLIFD